MVEKPKSRRGPCRSSARAVWPLLGIVIAAAGCPSTEDPEFEYDLLGDADSTLNPLCTEEYALCGDVLIPSPLPGEPRLMAIALYRNLPPAGPPFASLVEDEPPVVAPGGRYKVRFRPVLETGEFYVWANLYMEGGGEFIPANGTDFVGNVPDPLDFDGEPVLFPDVTLTLASEF